MDLATQRALQYGRNVQANNLGTPVSKLLSFLAKADDDDALSSEEIRELSDEDLGWRIKQSGMVIPDDDATAWVKNNRSEAESLFGDISSGESAADRLASLRRHASTTGRSSSPDPTDPSEEDIERLEDEGIFEDGEAWEEGVEEDDEDSDDYVEESEEEEDKDADHIFHHSNFHDDDKTHINHIREVDAAHDNKWSKALQELKDKGENPRVGSPLQVSLELLGPEDML